MCVGFRGLGRAFEDAQAGVGEDGVKAWVNWLPRSRIRNLRPWVFMSVSMRKLRAAWVVHWPVGLAVTPAKDFKARRRFLFLS